MFFSADSIIRARAAIKAALLHFLLSALVASLAAALVLLIWYPSPYDLLSGGRPLFLMLIGADIVCGPLLTLVLFSNKKSRRELFTDMTLVAAVQITALIYGLHTAHEARPLFLVHEIDRFRVITKTDYLEPDAEKPFNDLPAALRPRLNRGPMTVGIRAPHSESERESVMMESLSGGRDYAQRPEFYIPYDSAYQAQALARAKPLTTFIQRYPAARKDATTILNQSGIALEDAFFLPVLHRQEWVAILDKSAHILGFLPGDGFQAS